MNKWLQGWAPEAAGTCVAKVFGTEMTGDPAMLASGCVEDIEVMPGKIQHGCYSQNSFSANYQNVSLLGTRGKKKRSSVNVD